MVSVSVTVFAVEQGIILGVGVMSDDPGVA
jgi:hypothetical protein